MSIPLSNAFPEQFGFRAGDRGTHTSRTIMLAELRTLLDHLPVDASRDAYRRVIIEDNVLGKKTLATRRGTAKRLGELYALDPDVSLFRVLRWFWQRDCEGRPLLALLCAAARDPLLRLTADSILNASEGQVVTANDLDETLARTVAHRLQPAIRAGVARRAASSWTQSGHLRGHSRKIRQRPNVSPGVVGYALSLGYLQGLRGSLLFSTFWARLLDLSPIPLAGLAEEASRRAWINYRHAGGVVDVRFPALLTPTEEEACRGEAG